MNGKIENLFKKQIEFQNKIVKEDLPADSIEWSSYHILGLVEEVGELLRADKRWKTHRNEFYDRENKVIELADIFICLMNIAMFSNIGPEQFFEAVENKIKENSKKLKGE